METLRANERRGDERAVSGELNSMETGCERNRHHAERRVSGELNSMETDPALSTQKRLHP